MVICTDNIEVDIAQSNCHFAINIQAYAVLHISYPTRASDSNNKL